MTSAGRIGAGTIGAGTVRAVGDWGTSNLQLFKLVDDVVVARAAGAGVGQAGAALVDILRGALQDLGLDGGDVLLSGMAGSRMGLLDTGYLACPIIATHWRAKAVSFDLPPYAIKLFPGLSGVNLIGAPDVMRGEETQVFGAMAPSRTRTGPSGLRIAGHAF